MREQGLKTTSHLEPNNCPLSGLRQTLGRQAHPPRGLAKGSGAGRGTGHRLVLRSGPSRISYTQAGMAASSDTAQQGGGGDCVVLLASQKGNEIQVTSFTPDSTAPTCPRLEKNHLGGFHEMANTFLKMKKVAAAAEPQKSQGTTTYTGHCSPELEAGKRLTWGSAGCWKHMSAWEPCASQGTVPCHLP